MIYICTLCLFQNDGNTIMMTFRGWVMTTRGDDDF